MRIKETIKSQYFAALEMLRQVIMECPDSLWISTEYSNPFWNTVFHVLFYTHLYLQPREEDFVPWEKHNDEVKREPYSKEDLLTYLELVLEQTEEQVDQLDLDGESGFSWLPFDKLELQFYNIRHVQQHTGELSERLGFLGDTEVRWVGMKPG